MRITQLSGGVGGARLARGFDALSGVDLVVIVNVADDESVHGLHVSPDLDTVVYTLARVEGSQGWGRAGDTFVTNAELSRFGLDTTFRLGDLDLATVLFRTMRLADGEPLSSVTGEIAKAFGIRSRVVPATDDPVRTVVETTEGELLGFQEYFVLRRHTDRVAAIRYEGVERAAPAAGVVESIHASDLVVIGPSNPPLSIWPILETPGIRDAVARHPRVVAVSPLFEGRALKGPAARVMRDLGLPAGNAGVAAAYEDLIGELVVDTADAADAERLAPLRVTVTDTLIPDSAAATRLARVILRS